MIVWQLDTRPSAKEHLAAAVDITAPQQWLERFQTHRPRGPFASLMRASRGRAADCTGSGKFCTSSGIRSAAMPSTGWGGVEQSYHQGLAQACGLRDPRKASRRLGRIRGSAWGIDPGPAQATGVSLSLARPESAPRPAADRRRVGPQADQQKLKAGGGEARPPGHQQLSAAARMSFGLTRACCDLVQVVVKPADLACAGQRQHCARERRCRTLTDARGAPLSTRPETRASRSGR